MTLDLLAARLIELLRERQPRTSAELAPLLGVRPRDLPTIVGWVTENTEIVIDSRCQGQQKELGYYIYDGDDLAVIEHFKSRFITQVEHYNKRKRVIESRKKPVQGVLFP